MIDSDEEDYVPGVNQARAQPTWEDQEKDEDIYNDVYGPATNKTDRSDRNRVRIAPGTAWAKANTSERPANAGRVNAPAHTETGSSGERAYLAGGDAERDKSCETRSFEDPHKPIVEDLDSARVGSRVIVGSADKPLAFVMLNDVLYINATNWTGNGSRGLKVQEADISLICVRHSCRLTIRSFVGSRERLAVLRDDLQAGSSHSHP